MKLLLAAALVLASLAVVPSVSASHACATLDDTPPFGWGGVVGLTYSYAMDAGNVATGRSCDHSPTAGELRGDADTLADLTCVYLIGQDCL